MRIEVAGLSFTVGQRSVTGFLGPNGAGKSTTPRMPLGLASPDVGTVRIGDLTYAELSAPSDVVGTVLHATRFHPGRSGREHLWVYCTVNGYSLGRPYAVLELVGLTAAGRVSGLDVAQVGHIAWAERIELHQLTDEQADLEQVFFALTGDETAG